MSNLLKQEVMSDKIRELQKEIEQRDLKYNSLHARHADLRDQHNSALKKITGLKQQVERLEMADKHEVDLERLKAINDKLVVENNRLKKLNKQVMPNSDIEKIYNIIKPYLK